MQKARYRQALLQFTFGLLALVQYTSNHAADTIPIPYGTTMVMFVDGKGNITAVSPNNEGLKQCAPCPEDSVAADHSCKAKSVGHLEVCPNLTDVTVTSLEPLVIYHSQGSCYWGYSYRNGYFYYGYICR